MLYKCTVDYQPTYFVLQWVLLHFCQVQPEYLHQFYLTFCIEFFYQFHNQVLKLPDHIAPYFLLSLESLNKTIKILMKTNRKTPLLIDLSVLTIPLSDQLVNRIHVNLLDKFLFDTLSTVVVVLGESCNRNMLVVCIVDIEIFLPLVWEYGVELKEILTTGRIRTEFPHIQPQQTKHPSE